MCVDVCACVCVCGGEGGGEQKTLGASTIYSGHTALVEVCVCMCVSESEKECSVAGSFQ